MDTQTGKILLGLARNSIAEEFDSASSVDKEAMIKKYQELNALGASFVTLNSRTADAEYQLRGCIGTLYPRRSLIEDVYHNAKSAAFNDPRFEALQQNELKDISIEVSILSIPERINYKNIPDIKRIIIPEVHGVIIQKSFNRAVFLPDVWKKLPGFEVFFSHLCKKAGLGSNCLESLEDIFIFTVEKYSENDTEK
jgi:hypothetical protein